jgi:polyphosphate kinase
MRRANVSPYGMKRRLQTNNREISWLQFNARVLQEARDRRNPLYERIRFMAIFSSNLDEFFRVRVASLRSLLTLKKVSAKQLPIDPEKLLKKIAKIVFAQQETFGRTYQNAIIPDLAEQGIFVINEKEVSQTQAEFVRAYFREKVVSLMQPYYISKLNQDPFLQSRAIYLIVELFEKVDTVPAAGSPALPGEPQYALLEIPSLELPRFLVLPKEGKKNFIMFLDDVIRLSLKELFPLYEVREAYSIKLVRDGELHIDDEFQGDLLEKIEMGLRNRKRGIPCRFIYDPEMPPECLAVLAKFLRLSPDDLITGKRYHNFIDFFGFPNPLGASLENKPQPPLHIKELDETRRIHSIVRQKDILLHFPYISYDYVVRFLEEAANDPKVIAIKITLYRIANDSRVVEALKLAARNGKDVTAFIEVKARFDEESNLFWAGELERSGATVLYSFPGLKVHCKLCIVTRLENNQKKRYAYLATGNFNEKTAELYTDLGLFTTHEEITKEVNEVFKILARKERSVVFKHLLVAPFTMRKHFLQLIDREIKNARDGKKALVIAKLNSLEDPSMVAKLYEASVAGVKVQLIVRGICCAIPGVEEYSKNIKAISILDRYLEHARIYIFHNDGDERIFLSSADWMIRNLRHRIETAFPIYDSGLKTEIKDFVGIQLADNIKARIIAKGKTNKYRRTRTGVDVQSQIEIYKFYKKKSSTQ